MPWTEDFVDEHMYAVFRKGALGAHRQKFVLDREKARLPELQARARRYKIAVDTMEGRLKQQVEHIMQYNAVPVVAAFNKLEKEFVRKHRDYYDFAAKKWALYNDTWIRTPGQVPIRSITLREGVTQAEVDAFEAELLVKRKERTAADVVIGKYKLDNAAALAEAKRLYSAPAKVAATMPEYRQMVNSYGEVIRLHERDTRRIENYRRLFGEDAVEIVQGGEQATIQPRQVVVLRGCPGEGCRGFLNESWVCGVCDISVCRQCHIGLAEDEMVEEHHAAAPSERSQMRLHICDPDQVATAKMLARDTKPCPKCKALISKIDGCDQMWCTQCQTPFSWITGQVEEGRVHNPHYFEWQRRNKGSVAGRSGALLGEPAGPDDVGFQQGDCCAAALRLEDLPFDEADQVRNTTLFDNILVDVLENIPFSKDEGSIFEDAAKIIRGLSGSFLLAIYRKLVEIHEYYVRDRVAWNERYANQKDNEDAIDYLVGRLSEADWQRRVWSRDRARRFRNDCKEVKRMFYAAGRDILKSLTQGGGGVKVGEMCILQHGVTLGEKYSQGLDSDYPVVGNYVSFGFGSGAIGGVKIGNNVTVGAGSLILNDVGDNLRVAGTPAKEI